MIFMTSLRPRLRGPPVLQVNSLVSRLSPSAWTDPAGDLPRKLIAILIAIARPAGALSGHIGPLSLQLEPTAGHVQPNRTTGQLSLEVKIAGRIGAIAVLGQECNSIDITFDSSNISDANEIPGSQPGSH